MIKKILAALTALIIWLGSVVYLQPSSAQSGDDPSSRLFLPLVSRMEEPVWLGPESADVVTIAYDRRVEDRVYLGTWGAGVFVSEDGGITWKRRSSGLGNLFIQRLAVDPQQAGVVYAGTYGSGIYKTMDGGWNWYPINQGLMSGAIVYGLAVDPQQSNRVYASARVINRNGEPWGGVVYRSLDGGLTWQAVLQNIGGSNVQDWVYSLAVDPQNPQRVLAASHEHGVYRSQDYGSSWAEANEGITDLSGRAVAFDPAGSIAYVGVWHLSGEFKTLDGGNSWFLQPRGLSGSKIYDLVVNPLNPNQLLAATFRMYDPEMEVEVKGVARSDNGGAEWVMSGLQEYAIYSVAVNPFNRNEALAGTVDYGVFRSTDGGRNWAARNGGLINVSVTDVLFDPSSPQVWYAALTGQGVFRSTDNGNHWEDYNAGLEAATVYDLAWDAEYPQRLLALTGSGWMMKETDREDSQWQSLMERRPVISPVSYPAAVTGIQSLPPLPDFEGESGGDKILGMAENYASIEDLTLWAESEIQPSASPAEDLPFYGVIQTPAGELLAGTADGIYRRQAGGEWILWGLRGQEITALAVHPSNSDWLAAASRSQVWLSRDGGSNWQIQECGLPLEGILGVWFDPAGRLLVSLAGRGLLRLDLP
ncbi:MAG: hypothetical protein AB1522_03185 [Chloroflexota bacterium]